MKLTRLMALALLPLLGLGGLADEPSRTAAVTPRGEAKVAHPQKPKLETQKLRDEVRRNLNLSSEDLVKLARNLAGSIQSSVRHDADVARAEQREADLAALRAGLVAQSDGLNAEHERLRTELNTRLSEVREQFASQPQVSDEQQRRVIARYTAPLKDLKTNRADAAARIQALDVRLTQLRTDLAQLTLERDLDQQQATLIADSPLGRRGAALDQLLDELEPAPATVRAGTPARKPETGKPQTAAVTVRPSIESLLQELDARPNPAR